MALRQVFAGFARRPWIKPAQQNYAKKKKKTILKAIRKRTVFLMPRAVSRRAVKKCSQRKYWKEGKELSRSKKKKKIVFLIILSGDHKKMRKIVESKNEQVSQLQILRESLWLGLKSWRRSSDVFSADLFFIIQKRCTNNSMSRGFDSLQIIFLNH